MPKPNRYVQRHANKNYTNFIYGGQHIVFSNLQVKQIVYGCCQTQQQYIWILTFWHRSFTFKF
jgi:hypothetical protein